MKNLVTIANLLKGKVQGNQVPTALATDYFSVDERDQKYLLSYCTHIASVLDYYTIEGKKDGGSWEGLLMADVSVLTARISQYEGTEKFNQLLDFLKVVETGYEPTEQVLFTQKFFQSGFGVAVQIDEWYTLSSQNFSDSEMTSFLRSEISTRGSQLLNNFYGYYFLLCKNQSGFKNKALPSLNKLNDLWAFNSYPETSYPFSQSVARVATQASKTALLLFNWLDEIVGHAKKVFTQSQLRNDIPPHVGLLMAFLDVFKHQQDAINKITEKHLDFYFKQLLKTKKRVAVPDKAIVAIELLKINQLLLPMGTRFDAGKDQSGSPITFSTHSQQVITTTQITNFSTLTFPSSSDSSPGIILSTIKNFNEPGNKAWPLFGVQKATDKISIANATVGLAFSCSDLFLSQSTRKLTVVFTISNNVSTLDKSLKDAFNFCLTSTKGWFAPQMDAVTYDFNQARLTFVLSLAPGDPPIIAYSEELHGKGFDSHWPVCKLTLTGTGSLRYEALQKLTFNCVSISTCVQGASNFIVENDTGKLNAAVTFNPFNIQSSGSNLYVGGQEFFVKQLTALTLNISWDSLPKSFEQYYRAYNDYYKTHPDSTGISKEPVFLNQAFAADVFVLNNGEWIPAAGVSVAGNYLTRYKLFTDETTDALREASLVPNGMKSIVLQHTVTKKGVTPLPYNPTLQSFTSINNVVQQGFICITLCSPTQGFGYADYPTLVADIALANSEAIMHNAQLIVFKKKTVQPMPNIPYVPKIKSLDIDYTSSKEYVLNSSVPMALQWYHLHPFGTDAIPLTTTPVSLLPEYQCKSYLYFGLDTLVVDTELAFYFVLDNPVKSVTLQDSKNSVNEYFTDNGWQPLEQLSDGTDGFQRTGIIRFAVPGNATNLGGQMPKGLYWFRIGTHAPDGVTVSFVSTQGVEVVRDLVGNEEIIQVPAGTLTKLVDALPGIKKINQPLGSWGAVAKQTDNEFRTATVGRIRDKGRIATVSAIESSLLDKFSGLYKVVAIPLGYSDRRSAGIVDVIITPFTSSALSNCYRPMATPELMEDVMEYLLSIGLPSIRYQISNPDFYQLTIDCCVVFSVPNQEESLVKKLNEDIQNFLSPWIKDNPVKETFNSSNQSLSGQLYSFVKSLGYVQYIQNLTYTLYPEINDALPPNALIVSSAQHTINNSVPGAPANFTTGSNDGLRIGKNFLITE